MARKIIAVEITPDIVLIVLMLIQVTEKENTDHLNDATFFLMVAHGGNSTKSLIFE